jgi:hypothetical protein
VGRRRRRRAEWKERIVAHRLKNKNNIAYSKITFWATGH